MKNYFDYVMYLAFEALLRYEDKKSLTVEQLHKYRLKLCEQYIKYHEQFSEYDDSAFEDRLREFHKLNQSMTISDERNNFQNFINDNSEMFNYKNGVISLKDGVTLDDVKSEKFKLDSYVDRDDKLICGELISLSDAMPCLDVIGVKKIPERVAKIVNDEKFVESAYQRFLGKELEEETKTISNNIRFKLSLIGNLNDDKMRSYHRCINSIGKIDPEAIGNDIDLLSDSLVENDPFYEINRSVDYFLRDKYQKAIFDTGTLVYDVLCDVLNTMWVYRDPDAFVELEPVDSEALCTSLVEKMEQLEMYQDEYDDDEYDDDEYDEDDYMDQIELYLYDKRINMAFYLNYINHINEYNQKYGVDETLEKSKRRLLYVLDGYGDDLYNNENFNTALSNVDIDDLCTNEDFNKFYVASRLFLVDILENCSDDDTLLRKMLFVSTYYDLINDVRIKRIINKYEKTEIGKKVRSSIFEHNYNQFNESAVEKPKEMIKKFSNNDNGKKE